MTDREMLEFAAKAAGIEFSDGYFWSNNGDAWNPLTDDGDALRLAVSLRSYGVIISLVSVAQVEVLALRCDSPYEEFEDTDPDAATRRAIVRAAAEIGRRIAQQTARADLPEDNYYKTMAEAEETGRAAAEIGRQMK